MTAANLCLEAVAFQSRHRATLVNKYKFSNFDNHKAKYVSVINIIKDQCCCVNLSLGTSKTGGSLTTKHN